MQTSSLIIAIAFLCAACAPLRKSAIAYTPAAELLREMRDVRREIARDSTLLLVADGVILRSDEELASIPDDEVVAFEIVNSTSCERVGGCRVAQVRRCRPSAALGYRVPPRQCPWRLPRESSPTA